MEKMADVDALVRRVSAHARTHGQARTAQVLGISTRTLTRWLAGERTPTRARVQSLIDALDADADTPRMSADVLALALQSATSQQLADELVRRTHT